MKIMKYNNQKTLFFVSGMFGGDWVWSRCREYVSDSNHLVMANPLCALSPSFDELVELIVKEINSHHNKVTLVGSSLGGMLSLAVAKELPDKIEQVLIAGTAGFDKVDLQIKLHPRRAAAIADEIMSMVCHDKSVLSQDVLDSVAGEFRYNFKAIVSLIRDSDKIDGEAMLKSVSCPVNAIWGERDIVTPLSSVSDIFHRLNVPLTVLDDCGHCPMYEQPEAFSRWVNYCLANVEQQSIIAA